MNYERIYNEIIENRKVWSYDGYTERHHIIPQSFGGSDNSENLVDLSAREHFLCHYLLMKINENDKPKFYKMVKAFMLMCWYKGENHKRYLNSRLYKSYREKFADAQSFQQQGKNNSQYGTIWICNLEKKINKKIYKDDPVEKGWIRGRNRWIKEEKRERKRIYLEQLPQREKEESDRLLQLFIDLGYTSTAKFVKDGHYHKSDVTLGKLFNKYNGEKYRELWCNNLSKAIKNSREQNQEEREASAHINKLIKKIRAKTK